MSIMINEIFYSIQGEGARTGTPNVFVRLSGCNLTCNLKEHGFDCDTDFTGGYEFTAEELRKRIDDYGCKNVIWTGGEPTLQLTKAFADGHFDDLYNAVETNGTRELPNKVLDKINFVSCSPKTAEHTIRIQKINELRYVRAANQALPKPRNPCENLFLSPRFDPDLRIDRESLAWCIKLVKENPAWRLSVQTHKLLAQR